MKVKHLGSSDNISTINNVISITPIENGDKLVVESTSGERTSTTIIKVNRLLGISNED